MNQLFSCPVLISPIGRYFGQAVHNFFKEKLKFLVSDTIDGPDSSSKCIRLRLDSGRRNDKGRDSRKRKDRGDRPYDCRGSDSWPEHLGKFLRFHLYKENKDTQEALGLLGKMLGVQPRSFGFAGTKDKRSVSTQRVTVFKQRANRLAALNERLVGIKVGNFCHVHDGLLLGQLQGNRFTITLRSVIAENEDIIRESTSALGKHGFINYFGLQRFGSSSVPTHLIGAALLRGEWKTAVNLILDPREGERDAIKKIREYYEESGDIEGTLRQLPRHLVAERAILHCFQKSPGNYLQALLAIPRTLRMMFVHSYQSYLWNHAASVRVQKYGVHQIVLGDLVYCKDANAEDKAKILYLESKNGECDHVDDDLGGITDAPDLTSTLVKVIKEDDIVTGDYTVDDIILPLPGSRITYPTNDIEKVYHDLAEKDGISLTKSLHNTKEFSMIKITGAYRRVFERPKDFEWELVKYKDMDAPLAKTDWEIVAKSCPHTYGRDEKVQNKWQADLKLKPHKVGNEIEMSTESGEMVGDRGEDMQPEDVSKTQENLTALKLSFILPASCYATMAVRELLKTSTSVAFHKTLN
ncbi:multisubstrate pseudouridine synthase 7 isoform X2 [Primulina huaijiensis]|uniref:multisubstrate pseudouridine synthase 7 isoform X2 n=1 Tax=Primulina huaijiensis TaxID=1492673 RepID=UPI003CC754C0